MPGPFGNTSTALALSIIALTGSACSLRPPAPAPATSAKPTKTVAWNPAVIDTLMQLGRDDQLGRAMLAQAVAAQDTATLFRSVRADSAHSRWLRRTLGEHGWPTRAIAGDSAVHVAWLILQHSPFSDWQAEVLPALEELAARGEVPRADLALFTDRVLVHGGQPQRYGSQFNVVNKQLVPFPVADLPRLDIRRAEVGLPPMTEYVRMLGEAAKLPVAWPPPP